MGGNVEDLHLDDLPEKLARTIGWGFAASAG
jgi:hypothetical protein